MNVAITIIYKNMYKSQNPTIQKYKDAKRLKRFLAIFSLAMAPIVIYALFVPGIEEFNELDPCQLESVECKGEKRVKEILIAKITAYSEFDSCHTGKSCLMASGRKAYIGAIACPRRIELGTRVVIDNTSYICEDRASKKFDNRFDIFYGYGKQAYNEAIQFGIQEKEVKIYED